MALKSCGNDKFLIQNINAKRFEVRRAPVPRENFRKSELMGLYEFVSKWLIANKIYNIVGPVCSGAVMSYAIHIISGGRIQNHFTTKYSGKYEPRIHSGDINLRRGNRYAVIDDIISSGKEISHTIGECQKASKHLPLAILCLENEGEHRFLKYKIPIFEIGFRIK